MKLRNRKKPMSSILLILVTIFSLVMQPVVPALAAPAEFPVSEAPSPAPDEILASSLLYRTRVTISSPARWQRLEELGVVVLEETTADQQENADSTIAQSASFRKSAVVLADTHQLEALARLRFEPQSTDALDTLVTAHAQAKPWLAAGLRPLLAQAASVEKRIEVADAAASQEILADFRTAVRALTLEQQAGIAALTSTDDDADGLTNTQEQWWCTDPMNPDSDGDGANDGDEVQAAKEWLSNQRGSFPATGKPFAGWPPEKSGCRDDDKDSVPDLAERWDLGLNMNRESTDRDKFDDGQELFGLTHCPGSGGFCGYGALPRNEDWGVIFAEMPAWVKAPGDHPMVAAFPVPEIDVIESSLHVETVQTVTTDHIISEGTERSYSTAKTEGTNTSVANTEMWNEWQEIAKSSEQRVTNANLLFVEPTTPQLLFDVGGALDSIKEKVIGAVKYRYAKAVAEKGCLNGKLGVDGKLGVSKLAEIGGGLEFEYDSEYTNAKCRAALRRAREISPEFAKGFPDEKDKQASQQIQNFAIDNNNYNQVDVRVDSPDVYVDPPDVHVSPPEVNNNVVLNNNFDTESIVRGLEGMRLAYLETGELIGEGLYDISSGLDEISNGLGAVSSGLDEIAEVLAAPRETKTTTEGRSQGGSQTTTHTKIEEHTVTNGEAFSKEESWGTATARDSSHAADLWFTYRVGNTGTEYAREIADLAFNIYIGDDPNPAYTYFVGPDLGEDGKFHNFMPNESHTFTSRRIPLTLEQMKAIDLGGPVRVAVEDLTYGIDELFYEDAANAGIVIAIDDGLDDGDEAIDTYLIPTWGEEMLLDVLARYFPHTLDVNGSLIGIWTPEYRSDTPAWCSDPRRVGTTLWCRHALSVADWWNIYLNTPGEESQAFSETLASAGSVAFFRFNKDTDLDGYSDRSERQLYCALPTDHPDSQYCEDAHTRGDIYPKPELIAGIHSIRSGNEVTATLSIRNTGLYDAYAVQAVTVAPDDSISINDNTVGGSARVRAQSQVIVSSLIRLQSPLPSIWTQADHARPAVAGEYIGQQDRTYTFTVQCSNPDGCDVGSGTWSLAWDDGVGDTGTVNFGDGYASPSFLNVGTLGLKLALYTGKVYDGDAFTVDALTPRDTFQYSINREPYSEPLVIVSYNDARGNHRSVIPPAAMQLNQPDDDLLPYQGQMLNGIEIEIVTTDAIVNGANTTNLVVSNPTERVITDAQLVLEILDPDGKVVHQESRTVTLRAGPSVEQITWDTSGFSQAFDSDKNYYAVAFLTDYQNNILDRDAHALAFFRTADQLRQATAPVEQWDVSTLRWPESFNTLHSLFGTTHTEGVLKQSSGYRLLGSAGQPAAGTSMNSSNYSLVSGYWAAVKARQAQLQNTATVEGPSLMAMREANDAIDRFPTYRFTLANTGRSPLELRVADVPEDITIIQPPATPLGSGESTEVKVRLDTNNLGSGSFERIVPVYTNDPTQPEIQLRITGQTEPASELVFVYDYEDDVRPLNKIAHVNSVRDSDDLVHFEHGVSGDISNLYPLFLYAGDGTTLLGRGAAINNANPVLGQTAGDATSTNLTLTDGTSSRRDYIVHYGYQANVPSGGGQHTYQAPVPNQNYGAVTLDIVAYKAVSGKLDISLDVGADGSDEWSRSDLSITGDLVTVSADGLADAINAYLDSQSGDEVLVPIQLTIDAEGTYFLTNLQGAPSREYDLTIPTDITMSPDAPAETEVVQLCTNIVNDGPGTVASAVVDFIVRHPVAEANILIGYDVLTDIAGDGGVAEACVDWDTTGFTGDVTLIAVVDYLGQIEETNDSDDAESNNAATSTVTILSRPDLHVPSIELPDLDLVAGQPTTIQVPVQNAGQTDAGTSKVALYDGNPDDGGTLIGEGTPAVTAQGESVLEFTWTPTALGPHRLFVVSDQDNTVSEFDELNNATWQDVYVGFESSILLNSGSASDVMYASERGYGAVDPDQDDELEACSDNAAETYRRDPGGRIVYQFDHLLPGHYYHLDVTLYACNGGSRQETIYVDGNPVTEPVSLVDTEKRQRSILLDPALYADHAITVSIETDSHLGTLVSEVNLHDIDYRYADAGGPKDVLYSTQLGYGALDGVEITSWGVLPYETVRTDQRDNDVQYQFDNLDARKTYQLKLTFWLGSGGTQTQMIQIDQVDAQASIVVEAGADPQSIAVSVPPSEYETDGSIVARIARTDDSLGPVVSEIALEEETVTTSSGCTVQATPSRMDVYGSVTIDEESAPVGTIVQAISPRGHTVGCFVVETSGQYGFMPIYGEDATADPLIPGMRDGELVEFRVNGAPAVVAPPVYWQDGASQELDLAAGGIEGQSILLSPGWNLISLRVEPPATLVNQVLDSLSGRYDRVLGEAGIWAADLEDRFITLKEMHNGHGYYLRLTGDTSANLLVEGLTVDADTPIELHQGWNWIGYLPDSPLPIEQALQSIDGLYQRVLSLDKAYDPDLPEFSTLTELRPGEGYLIYMDQAATLTYPAGSAALSETPAATDGSAATTCAGVQPTPFATLVYGDITINEEPAPAGTRVEVLTPEGDVAGCFRVEKVGQYGLMHVYGADPTAEPPIPGFKEGDPLQFRVNGVDAPLQETLIWQDDKAPHRIDLSLTIEWPYRLHLPLVVRGVR